MVRERVYHKEQLGTCNSDWLGMMVLVYRVESFALIPLIIYTLVQLLFHSLPQCCRNCPPCVKEKMWKIIIISRGLEYQCEKHCATRVVLP